MDKYRFLPEAGTKERHHRKQLTHFHTNQSTERQLQKGPYSLYGPDFHYLGDISPVRQLVAGEAGPNDKPMDVPQVHSFTNLAIFGWFLCNASNDWAREID